MKDTSKNDAQQAQEVQNAKAAANDILQSLSNINNIENFTIKYNELISSGALDPDSPNFDIDLFNSDFFISAELSSYLDNFKEQLSIYLNSKEYQRHAAIVEAIYKYVKENGTETDTAGKLIIKDNYKRILSCITELAQLIETDPEYNKIDVADIMKAAFDDTGKPIDAPFIGIINNTQPAAESNYIYKPTDKLNSYLFNSSAQKKADPNYIEGQVSFDDALTMFQAKKPSEIATDSKDPNIYVLFSAKFEDNENITIDTPEELTAMDQDIHDVVATILKEGIRKTSATYIYKRLHGKDKKPNMKDIKAIDKSLHKLKACQVKIDNTIEIEAGRRYKHFKYGDSLLNFRRIEEDSKFVKADGKEKTENKEIYYEFAQWDPIMFKWAESRNQITTITTQQWAVPINSSSMTNNLKRYLQRQIAYIKNSKSNRSNKILFATIFEECNITQRNRKADAKKYVGIILDHWKDTKYIEKYIIDKDNTSIFINPTAKQIKDNTN